MCINTKSFKHKSLHVLFSNLHMSQTSVKVVNAIILWKTTINTTRRLHPKHIKKYNRNQARRSASFITAVFQSLITDMREACYFCFEVVTTMSVLRTRSSKKFYEVVQFFSTLRFISRWCKNFCNNSS